ncbi:short-chain alcohol dehydrogenase-like protein [Thermochaetoides thermophila DSM 1495]|uniref:Short-chain alcohol dehydrogenase-like protein n=1 Tax=Chaetomium thermophilum (strain DSM 1495 / CBS 144.50 / IMI 039719) TaxID=759272 RepID=G0SBF8_CHATD|nr:short-chain alcohol dehydrogenase-like protein [Thermochaetoides thermophila DSM 1495]EGS19538.1 short-chain alcohol dehydrogenase-like protein [Thermochaetoides thermophila DSM 1495]
MLTSLPFFSKSISFDPVKDIPSLAGKVILVTGGNSGLGKQSVLDLARHSPAQIYLCARNVEKGHAAAEDIKKQVPGANITVLELDLASFDSIKKAASTVLALSQRLDILLANAGIMYADPAQTADGYELQFGTNHMGHALLVKLLLPLLTKTAETPLEDNTTPSVRVIFLSSMAHMFLWKKDAVTFDDCLKSPGDNISWMTRYARSKLSNLLYARALAKRYPNLTVVAVHPGGVRTSLIEDASKASIVTKIMSRFLAPVEQGVRNQLWAATAKAGVVSGEYYEPVGLKGMRSGNAKDEGLAEKLWEYTEKELEGHSL